MLQPTLLAQLIIQAFFFFFFFSIGKVIFSQWKKQCYVVNMTREAEICLLNEPPLKGNDGCL